MTLRAFTLALLIAGCPPDEPLLPAAGDTADTSLDRSAAAVPAPDCTEGLPCAPVVVDRFPRLDIRSTAEAPSDLVDAWPCAPDTDESGPEVFYEVVVPRAGILTAEVLEDRGADIDVHLLAARDPGTCLTRGDTALAWPVQRGVYTVVADTYAGAGDDRGGRYHLAFDFLATEGTTCATRATDLRMAWPDCAPGVDCYRAADASSRTRSWLRTPAVGRVVEEAHLATVRDAARLGGWPAHERDGLAAHYADSAALTGQTELDEPWAPDSPMNVAHAQGAHSRPLPVEDEAWYVNMYWKDRPEPGTRMLLVEPRSGRAVVASAGWETGPGSHRAIGGAVEEVHRALGSVHGDRLVMAFLEDQDLPLGPVDCGWGSAP